MVLELKAVSHIFSGSSGRVEALKSVNLTVKPSELLAINGPSGSGKSTLLMVAGTLLRPTSGTVLIEAEDPYALAPNKRAGFRSQKVGFVFQSFHLVPYLSVRDNVLAPLLSATLTASEMREFTDRTDHLLRQFGLQDRAQHLPSELSSGERQRCALARALLKNPPLLLADEPTGNLDDDNARLVFEALRSAAEGPTAVVLVTHDHRSQAFADRHLVIEHGVIRRPEDPSNQPVSVASSHG